MLLAAQQLAHLLHLLRIRAKPRDPVASGWSVARSSWPGASEGDTCTPQLTTEYTNSRSGTSTGSTRPEHRPPRSSSGQI